MATANFNFELKNGWKFHLGEIDIIAQMPIMMSHETSKAGGSTKEFDMFGEKTEWHDVEMPHDWMTEQPIDKTADPAGGFKKRGTGWYYLSFNLPEDKIERARLVFDGVFGKTVVHVNGVVAARNVSGYNRFSCEIGDYLLAGAENNIALYVDASRWEGWWYEGAGLYRKAYIEFRQDVCFEQEKAFVRGVKTENGWITSAQLKINGIKDDNNAFVKVCLTDAKGNVICEQNCEAKEDTEIEFSVTEPQLWSPESPNLYDFVCELVKGGEVIDSIRKSVGFRDIEWKKDEGMFLNGSRYQINGICCHQDHAGVGVAIPKEVMEYRISVLKRFGINAYRCAHHAPTEDFLEICDRMGMLVMAENRHFAVSEDVFKQLESLVYVSRNHPSVFLYSLFNEERWQGQERGMRIAAKMREKIRSLDDTRAVTGAQDGGLLESKNTSDVLDIIGVNYFIREYDEAHKRIPDKVILGTENFPTYATRGVYETNRDEARFSNYGEDKPKFSESLIETLEFIQPRKFVAECFAWSGFDYRGEPTPCGWPSVISHWGFTDDCGFAKDTAYWLEAWYKQDLVVHLLPHWNWKKGDTVRVCAFTNADQAELFLNGKSLGIKQVDKKRCDWMVEYEEGTITVVARRGENEVKDRIVTTGKAAYIKVDDQSPDSPDTHILNVFAVDDDGNCVPDYCEKISIECQNGRILGVGNGNPNSHHSEKAPEINFFNGKAQVIIRCSKGGVRLTCGDLNDAVYSIGGSL